MEVFMENTFHSKNTLLLPSYKGNNITDVQYLNRRLILTLIRRNQIISRIDLAELSGLKPATITLIINEFIEKGLVEDCGLIEGKNGRKVKGICLAKNQFCTISLRITSSYYAIGLFDINSECIAVEKISGNIYENFYQSLVDISHKINQYVALSKNMEVLGISIGVSDSFMFYDEDYIYYDTTTGKEINISEYFATTLNFPIYIERSSDFTSYWLYNEKTIHNIEEKIILTLPISSSIELSVLSHGQLYHGIYSTTHCMENVYVKDIFGSLKRVEDIVTVDSIIQRTQELLPKFPNSPLSEIKNLRHRDIIEAYAIKDPLTLCLYNEVADALAQLILLLINIIAPHYVFIGDEIPPTEMFLNQLKAKVKEHSTNPLVLKTEIVIIPAERKTQRDPVLRGGNIYIIDNELSKINPTI